MENKAVEQFTVPTGKTKAVAQFNKQTRELTGILTVSDYSTLNQDDFVYHPVEIDFNLETLVGNADNFQIKAYDDLPKVVYEESLDIEAQTKAIKEYPLMQRVAIFGRAVKLLSNELGVAQPELDAMLEFIEGVVRENVERKEFFRLSPDHIYKSYADAALEDGRPG